MLLYNDFEKHTVENGNMIIGKYTSENSEIIFTGRNNILVCNGVHFLNSRIRFTGDNSVMFFDENGLPLSVDARTGYDSVLYLGKDNYINPKERITLYATERKHIVIGNGCLLSFGSCFYTSDPHLIYDFDKKRVNRAKSILIGDHVWIGQNSLILKGSRIGSGSIIGGHSVVTAGDVPSNCVYAGNPAKIVKDGVYFSDLAAHNFDEVREMRFSEDRKGLDEKFVYENDISVYPENFIDMMFDGTQSASEKFDKIKKELSESVPKNRFFIEKKKID